jgi:hypothetical protein
VVPLLIERLQAGGLQVWFSGRTKFRFRDPLNQERRFIPLRLGDALIKTVLPRFPYLNWRNADRALPH